MKTLAELKPNFKYWESIKDMIDQHIDVMLNLSQSGHPGGSRSKVYALVSTLLSGAMSWDIRNPGKRFGDRFILSAGHANPVVYATLAVFNEALRRKYQQTGNDKYLNPLGQKFTLTWEDVLTLRRRGGLPGHAEMEGKTLFFKSNTGPSGHGFPIAAGQAFALKYAGMNQVKVFTIEGEGGLTPGVIHETKNSAYGLGLGNFITLVDWNDFGIDGKIHTIDYVTHDQKFLQYFKKSEKINQRITSRRKLWEGLAEKSWTDKIQVLSGYTANIVANKKLPPIDFFFIDGPHFYRGFKHDFMSSILLSNSNPFFLFDDYIDRPDYGVKKFVDKELINKFKTTLIKNDQSERPIRNGITKSDYGMCTLEASKNELIDNFGLNNIKNYLKEYKHYENRLKLRNALNKKIPFLKNIRFSKIFKSKI